MLSLAVFLNPDSITPVNGVYPAIQTSASLPSLGLIGSINGLLSGVFAYAGLQLFVEFMAEMKRPHDFLKVRLIAISIHNTDMSQGMFIAQAVIYTVYVVYGCFMYYVCNDRSVCIAY